MLTHTFCHIPGIGAASERRLWTAGLRCWESLNDDDASSISPQQRQRLRPHIEQSRSRLEQRDAAYFGACLPPAETWRMASHFKHAVGYLDIETTGLATYGDHVTTIALYDGRQVRHYVHGQNLDRFARDVAEFALMVTYNGKCFDLPFLRSTLGVQIDQAHIDLRYVLASLGHKGGLKGCERKLGIARGGLDGVDGFMAVLLWQEYRRTGSPEALETLLAYNIQDVLNLERLLWLAYQAKLAATPFSEELAMPEPVTAPNPFTPDARLVARLQGQLMATTADW